MTNAEIDLLVSQMRTISGEYKLDRAVIEPLHNKLVKELDSLMDYPVRKNELLTLSPMDCPQIFYFAGALSNFFISTHNIIVLNVLTIRMTGDVIDWDSDEVVEKGDENELYGVIAHEYFHSIFQDNYSLRLKNLIKEPVKEDKFGMSEGAKVRAINEAFAFWGGEALSERNSFKNQDFNEYVKLYQEFDIAVLEKTYKLLKQYEQSHGKKYVATNLVKIVNDEII